MKYVLIVVMVLVVAFNIKAKREKIAVKREKVKVKSPHDLTCLLLDSLEMVQNHELSIYFLQDALPRMERAE